MALSMVGQAPCCKAVFILMLAFLNWLGDMVFDAAVPEVPAVAAAAGEEVKDEHMLDDLGVVAPAAVKVKAAAAMAAAAAAHETGEAERLKEVVHTPRRSRLLSGGDAHMGTIGEGPEEEEENQGAWGLDALADAAVEDVPDLPDDLPMLEGYEEMPGPGEGFGEGGGMAEGREASPTGSWGSSNAGSGAAAAGDLEERDDLGDFDSIAGVGDAGVGPAGDMSMFPSSPTPGTPGRTDDLTPGGGVKQHKGVETAGEDQERAADGPVVQPFDMWAAQVRLWPGSRKKGGETLCQQLQMLCRVPLCALGWEP